jgi:hypothetical protein
MAERAPIVELEIQGQPERGQLVPLRTFARATESLTDLLTQIAIDRPANVEVDWFVRSLHEDNVILTIESRATTQTEKSIVNEIVRTTLDALDLLEHDGDVRDILSFSALENAHTLASLANKDVRSIVVRGSNREVSLTATAAVRAEATLKKRYRSIGSIEGTIDTVSEQEAGPYFVLLHRLDEYEIVCRCSDELLPEAKSSLGARVLVSGTIYRRYDGRVEGVEATELYVFPPDDQLPQVSDIRGIFERGELMPLSEARRRNDV